MLRSTGSGGPDLDALRGDYEARLDRAARRSRDEILAAALPLRDQKRYNDALSLVRGYPEGFRPSKYGPELAKLAEDIDREWSLQIASDQGRSKWSGWSIPWGENGAPPSVLPSRDGRRFVLVTSPSAGAFALERDFSVPEEGSFVLSIGVAAEPGETWELRVSVKDKVLKRQTIGKGDGGWEEHVVDLSAFKGTTIRFRFEAKAAGGKPKACYWSDIDLSATK
jgi:hypothetical protein